VRETATAVQRAQPLDKIQYCIYKKVGDWMNSKQRATLAQIFETPTRKDIPWSDVESLLRALGASIKGAGGSMVGVKLSGYYAVFHQPHPQRVTYLPDVLRLRRFLEKVGQVP
jgi:hypothetical protein